MFNVREEMECLLFCNRESCAIFDRFIADLIYCELHTFFEALSSYLHSVQSSNIRYRPRFFDQVGHQTTSAYFENKHFFTKSCHCQTYQNYEQPPQSLQNLYFQSHFSASKIKRIFLIFFSVKNI